MICAIVPAAGRSRRMNTQKLLLPFGGQTVIRRVVDSLLQGGVNEVVVVTGPESEAIRAALQGLPVRFAVNPDTGSDMLASIRCGLRALPTAAQTIVLLPGDHPAVSSQTIHALLAAYATCGRAIMVPVHAGRHGHPLVFSARFRDELLAGYESTGVRGLLTQHADEVAEWPAPDTAVIEDLDMPADYERALRQFEVPR
jgi:molybdenum cofactor cytidylyltransferase